MKDLEELSQEGKGSWLKRAFKEEWPTMANHLASCGVALGAAAGFSHYAPELLGSDAAISGIATALDMGGYWGAMIPQLAYRDRKTLKDENGGISTRKVLKKVGEYLGYVGVLEGIYAAGRFFGQYQLQKHGWDPAAASIVIQASLTGLLTFTLPPIRYAVRQWSEK